VKIRVITLGSAGAKIEEHGKETITVGCPLEKNRVDPTGIGDNFRSGFLSGLSAGLDHETCAQLGSLLATYCLETKGTQEYRFTETEFLDRFELAYGEKARSRIAGKVKPHLVG